jgi:long-chain acyl-CoA synthetase
MSESRAAGSTEGPSADSASAWGTDTELISVLGHACLSYQRRRHHLRELLVDGRRFAERDYLVQGEDRLTFAQHEMAVAATAQLLRQRGIGPGDRVLLYAANSADWVVTFWAIHACGAVVVLGNAWWSAAELSHAVTVVAPSLVVTDAARADAVPQDVRSLALADVAASRVAAVGQGALEHEWSREPGPDEDAPAVILFTSGTTGMPKGAVLSHRGIIATLQALAELTRRLPVGDKPLPQPSTALLSIPLFHIGGLQQVLTPMLAGGTLVFTEGRFDPAGVARLIEREGVTVWSTVPTMVSKLMDHLGETAHPRLGTVRTVGLGGSPVGQQLRARIPEHFPNASKGLAVTYGLSEGGGVLVTGNGPEMIARPGAVGKALKIVTLRIHEPDENGVGEIVVRSPSVMLGYWDSTAPMGVDPGPITDDRWLFTGDIGRVDDDGYLYVTDRSKDVVIRGGENIATPHVENRLLEHPNIREAAVFGLPHEHLGEEVAAVIVVAPGAVVSTDELATFAAAELAYFEVPTRWQVREEALPQNATGKVVKRLLKEEWLASVAKEVAGS